MTSTHTSGQAVFEQRTRAVLDELESNGQYKHLQMIEGPMGPSIDIRGMGTVDCFCSNNYLGLANHPEVVDAGIEALKKWGAGTASVRFICGTFTAHEQLENQIASFLGVEASYTFVSCWTATEAFFATVCEPGDVIVSDALNHACIIDAMRLTTVIKKGVH
ncbi:MAG: aminotransferase class I/II-fold pyridoxal phosphate-dependent enzyme, partial [Phycisphaerae bacterium]|nr:aminotransferase class I/II-fold pyridoxal phosphate-dependent enzyme [Phycisphaerae bacterium]